jgi:CNT family concentrative nucleoside transporter
MPPIAINLLGIVAILAIAFLLSSGKRRIRLRVVGPAFALQVAIAALVLGTKWGAAGIQGLANGVAALLSYAGTGTEFLFGASTDNPLANTFALGALPVIIFFAALVSILYHLGIMQRVVRWVGGAIGFVTGISQVESLGAAANIFVGQSESPLVVRPYLAALPPSGVFTLMTVGMAGVAGTILAAYAGLLGNDYLPFLLAAAFMHAGWNFFAKGARNDSALQMTFITVSVIAYLPVAAVTLIFFASPSTPCAAPKYPP